MRWLSTADAERLLTYAARRRVIRDFATLPAVAISGTLVRHATPASAAPGRGRTTRVRSTPRAARRPRRWRRSRHSPCPPGWCRPARAVACRRSNPWPALLDLPIEVDSAFDEPVAGQNPDENVLHAAGRLAEIAADGHRFAVCSQGKVIPGALDRLLGKAGRPRHPEG